MREQTAAVGTDLYHAPEYGKKMYDSEKADVFTATWPYPNHLDSGLSLKLAHNFRCSTTISVRLFVCPSGLARTHINIHIHIANSLCIYVYIDIFFFNKYTYMCNYTLHIFIFAGVLLCIFPTYPPPKAARRTVSFPNTMCPRRATALLGLSLS